MSTTQSTIKFAKRRVIDIENAIAVMESLLDIPYVFDMSILDGLWCELSSLNDLKKLRRLLGDRCIPQDPASNFRKEKDGTFIFHYEVALNSIPEKERFALSGKYYTAQLEDKYGPSTTLCVCVAPSEACTKIEVGSKTIYKWVCNE